MHIVETKLMDLKVDPANVRKTDLVPDESLLASIRNKGMLVPLTVRRNGPSGYLVTDGQKRLAALHILQRDGEFDKETPVKCVLQEVDAAAAADISLTTNFIREDMHPVDIYEAFAELKACGKAAEDIAKGYGLPLPEVRQYLALGQLSPKVREVWKTGQFSPGDADEIARLFTLAGDHAQQDAMLEKLKKSKRLSSHWQVKDAIVGNSNEGAQLVTFVGPEAYKAAGGKMREDLFGSNHILEDLPIARRLADEKLKAECERLVGLGWSWAEPLSALPKGCEHSWQRAYESAEQFAKTKRKDWGLAVYIGRDGKLDEYILQKPEQKKAADKAAKTKAAKKGGGGDTADKEEVQLSAALNIHLTQALTDAAAEAIIGEPDLAFSIALAALMSAKLGADAVRLEGKGLGARRADGDDDEWEFPKALAHVLKLTPKQRSAAFALYVGRSFDFTNGGGSPLVVEEFDDGDDARIVCESISVAAMKKALLGKFNAAAYFNGVSKSMGVKAILECRPEKRYAEKDFATNKKADIVNMACDAAHDTDWLPPELRTKHYDGPGSKGWKSSGKAPSAAKASPKKAPAKKKAR
jgi:ParB family chromosome partitioning protein